MSGRRLLGPLVLSVTAACAMNSAPAGYLPTSSEASTDVHGGWIELRVGGYGPVWGELVAVSPDTIWVLDGEGGRAVSTRTILEGKLTGWDTRPASLGWATFGGMLTTISNGVFLVFTAPAWLIVGSLAAQSQSRLADLAVPRSDWTDLAPFARFPQGMPEGVRLVDLTPKRR